MKRIVIGCDGTWQDLETPDPTNVRRICEAVAMRDGDIEQLVYYSSGIGTRNVFDKLTGGAFGLGINVEIADAYTFLCANYNVGDEIYLFGFSRGAYTVRSLAGLIYSCGILRREELSWLPNAYALYRQLESDRDKDLAQRLQVTLGHGQTTDDPLNSDINIRFLGVWDTVGALGIPDLSRVIKLDKKSKNKHRFHNTYISPIIEHARHAVAIDERRKVFRHTEMNPLPDAAVRKNQVRQVWFPGDHGSVGGGGDGLPKTDPNKILKEPHSDAALGWMIDEIRETDDSSLKFSEALQLNPDPLYQIATEGGGYDRRMSDPNTGPQPSNQNRDRRPYCDFGDIHSAAITRWENDPTYRPANLKKAHGKTLKG